MPAPRAVVDVLQSLLDAEQDSCFRFVAEGSPYLGRASVDVRKALAYVSEADHRRAGELWRGIEGFGGAPRRGVNRQPDQLLAYLSVKFILPKLVETKELRLERYRNAVAALADIPQAPPAAADMVRRLLSEHAAELEVLHRAAEEVAAK